MILSNSRVFEQILHIQSRLHVMVFLVVSQMTVASEAQVASLADLVVLHLLIHLLSIDVVGVFLHESVRKSCKMYWHLCIIQVLLQVN